MSIQTNNLPDNPQIEVIKSGKTGLFTNYIYKAIPLAFDESMSYYETLCGLLYYLQNTIIPTVNNNADAVAELQSLYEQLRSYVDNYFTNLDVQEEINNKLDQMVTDGTLPEIVASYLNTKAIFGFDNVESMKNATNLINGSYAQTLGYYNKNDGGNALYKIRNITTSDVVDESKIIKLNNNLIAELINFTLNREQMMNTNYFVVNSNKLSGISKTSKNPINQMEDKISCVDVQYNESLVENIRIENTNNYPDKIGLNLKTPGQRQKIDSVYIGNNFKIGMNIPTAYYSQFNDIWSSGEIGILIGDSNQPENWIGVLDFNACHINSSTLGVKEVSKDTNTICFDKCSFENNINSVENNGLLYFSNTYFGDNKQNTNTPVHVCISNAGSETHFDDCTISMVASDFTPSSQNESLIYLKSNDGVGSKVYINGGKFNISNNNIKNSISSIYETDSDLNEIYIDYTKFIPSTLNNNHNYFPYYLYKGYSPLRSLNPIKNYILNGTMKNPLGNTLIGVETSHGSADPNLTNPFGGKVFTFTREGTSGSGYSNFYYKIPKELIGKKMILEIYGLSSTNKFDVKCDNFSGLGIHEMLLTDTHTSDTNRVKLFRYEVTPTQEQGLLQVFIHWNDTSNGAWYKLSGVVLKEYKYKDYLSCYEDQPGLMSKTIPTDTVNAKKGDIVLSSPESDNTKVGWIFNGTKWVDYISLNNT